MNSQQNDRDQTTNTTATSSIESKATPDGHCVPGPSTKKHYDNTGGSGANGTTSTFCSKDHEATRGSVKTLGFLLQKAPKALRWDDKWIKTTAAISGILIGLGMSVAVYSLCKKQSFLGRLFNLDSAHGVLPTIMLCMYFWGSMLLFLRWMRARCAEFVTSKLILIDLVKEFVSTSLPDVLSLLDKSEVTSFSPLLRRIRAVLHQWIIRPNLQDASILLEHHAVSDDELIRHGYTIVRTFVWSLPVLGLIGTVVGIALAVGDFGRFIGSNVENIAAIKLSLVHVTGGLSYAFSTTLLGLLEALLLVLPASALQTREEMLSTRTQHDISDIILPALQSALPESITSIGVSHIEGMRETLNELVKVILNKVGDVSEHITELAERRYIDWSDRLREESIAAADSLGQVVGKPVHDLEAASGEFLTRLSLVKESLDQQAAEMHNAITVLVDSSSRVQAALSSAVESQQRSVQTIGERLQGLAETTNKALQAQQALQSSMERITQSDLDMRLSIIADAIQKVSMQTKSALEAAQSLTMSTTSTLDSQRSLQDAMAQLHQMRLPETLDNFSHALQQISEVLAHFQEPIVFQAVRVSSVMAAPSATREMGHVADPHSEMVEKGETTR